MSASPSLLVLIRTIEKFWFWSFESYGNSSLVADRKVNVWQAWNDSTFTGNHVEITCCKELNTHLKWLALRGNCINCSIDQSFPPQWIVSLDERWSFSLSLPAASHNLKHLTHFMRSVRFCGDSWREAPAVITGRLPDYLLRHKSFTLVYDVLYSCVQSCSHF